jgi:enterochelin esterase family protein
VVKPGIQATGTEPQPGPYTTPPEATAPLQDSLQGTLSAPAFYSSAVYGGLKFSYQVYVPAQYRPGTPAALMVFQDGPSVYLDVLKTPWVLDHLIHRGEIPVTIALFIDPGTPSGIYHTPDDDSLRSMEYDTLDDTYSRFVLDEILPAVVLRQYTIVNEPDGWAIAGQSSGGIAAFTVAWHRPDRFHKVLTQNGSFANVRGGNVYPDLIRQTTAKPLRVYLLSGTHDLNNSWGNWLEANTAMAAAFAAQGYVYRYRTGTGEHFPPLQALADYPGALRWLWHGYRLPP